MRSRWSFARQELLWRVTTTLRRAWRTLLGCWRVLRAVLHVLAGWLTIKLVFPRLQSFERHLRVQAWAAGMLQLMGVTLELTGQPPASGPMLLVANHNSWLDILALHAVRHCRFVAKSEVRHWPIIGAMATAAGTLYIERRSSRDAMRVVHEMAASLERGEVLAVFPEGTTTSGFEAVLPFHGNLIQPAIVVDAPVVPVGLFYFETVSGRGSGVTSYIDDDSLAASVWRMVSSTDDYSVWLRFGKPQRAEGRDRRRWAADLREAVARLRSSASPD